MLVLHIMASRALGGAETYSADVILGLHLAGVTQCVVMHRGAPRYAELKSAGVPIASWPLSVPFAPLQRVLLRRLIGKLKPSIAHCWMRRAAGLVAARPPPVVIGWFGGYYDPAHFRCCTHFVGVTQDIATHMTKHSVPPERVSVVPTFSSVVPATPIDRDALATPADAKVLVTLSRLHEKKGLDTLLLALRDLPECYAWLAGDGPLRRELEGQARELGVSDRVRFLGWRNDRGALLAAADICVLPSRYEPFGTVILEAWATGTPLVACRSNGPAAHIRDGVDGLLVPVDDAPGLAAAIRRVLGSDALRRRLVAEGSTVYFEKYTREAVIAQWVGLYRRLVAGAAD